MYMYGTFWGIQSDVTVSDGVISVQAPLMSKDSTKVLLEKDMTAKDIVVKFYNQQMASSSRKQQRALSQKYLLQIKPPGSMRFHLKCLI